MAYSLNSAENPVVQWVSFYLHNEVYGIEVTHVQEVLKVSEVTPVPGAPEFVLGVINMRGNVVTVVDTRMRFGLPEVKQNDSSRIIIVESGELIVGLMVDRVAEVVYLYSSEIERVPNIGREERAKYILGVHNQDKGLLILVDVNQLLANVDRDEILDS